MRVIVATIDTVLFDGDALSVNVPGTLGDMTILDHHVPLITDLRSGKVSVKLRDGSASTFVVNEGLLEVSQTHTSILLS